MSAGVLADVTHGCHCFGHAQLGAKLGDDEGIDQAAKKIDISGYASLVNAKKRDQKRTIGDVPLWCPDKPVDTVRTPSRDLFGHHLRLAF